jgi:ketosteroid isomerase-like protein
MQSWLAKRLVNRNLRHLNAGNPGPSVRMDARDVELTFPGSSSWAGVIRGKRAHRAWLGRFCQAGLQIFADEVMVKGRPWRTTICVRGHDHLDAPDGERVYENRYVIWGLMRWGRLKRYEVYEDTERTLALDRWLEQTGHPAARPVAATGRQGRRPRRAA